MMNFIKVKLRIPKKADGQKKCIISGEPLPEHEEPKPENNGGGGDDDYQCKSANLDAAAEAEEDDDDFITNEVKRRLKELRRNSFMVLIPEEEEQSCEEDDEEGEGETCSNNEWRDVEAEGQQWWRGFDAVFEKYCERMLFFDRMSTQQLNEAGKGSQCPSSTQSPRSASKKLAYPLRCLSSKQFGETYDETDHLQQPPQNDPYQDLETAYVGQVCLTWEALHCQYSQMCQKVSWQPESPICYNQSAQQFQQFQVLLQRFIENEPFEKGLRAEIYARMRNTLPKLLHVPNVQDQVSTEDDLEMRILAPDLIRIMENSILTFKLFLKRDKKKPSGAINLVGNQNQLTAHIQEVQSSLEKKAMKFKELRRKRKGWKKRSWPQTQEEIQLLMALIDIKILSRVMSMTRITKEQLFWCEEKMKKLNMTHNRLERDPCPILFPC